VIVYKLDKLKDSLTDIKISFRERDEWRWNKRISQATWPQMTNRFTLVLLGVAGRFASLQNVEIFYQKFLYFIISINILRST